MATINNIYVFVTSEDVSRSTKIPQHPVEKGLPLTDSVRDEPKTLSISGKIVNTDKDKAADIITKIEKLRTSGSLINYIGRNANAAGNYMIKSFDTSHPNTVWGGAEFSMELVEVRTAKSAYDPAKQKKAEKAEQKTNPVLEVGAKVVFKGGSVYVSSDAKKAAANRERQTCEITKISTKSWSIHQYHLISTEKKYPYNVYGWVDKSNIEGTTGATTKTSSETNAGMQQVSQEDTKIIYGKSATLVEAGVATNDITFSTLEYVNSLKQIINDKEYIKYALKYYLYSSLKIKQIDGGRTKAYYIPKGTKAYEYLKVGGLMNVHTRN